MTDDKLTVWGARSVRAMRVIWTALELGLDFDHRPIGSRTGETATGDYRKLNPRGKIPVLQHGSLVLTESAAICAYLTEAFRPPDGFFVPQDAVERARLNAWCYFVMTELDAHSLYLIRRHDALADIYGAEAGAVAAAEEYFLKQVTAMADEVSGGGPYLMGHRISIGDVLLMTCLDWAASYGIALPPPYPDYRARLAVRAKYKEAVRIIYPDGVPSSGRRPTAGAGAAP